MPSHPRGRSTGGRVAAADPVRVRGLLSNHVLTFFHRDQLRQITVAEVDRYREAKLLASRRQDSARATPDGKGRGG